MTNSIPKELKYTNSHEWVRDEGDGTVTIGITDHAQELLGDIVFVELPAEEKSLEAGDGCAVVESVKAAADVYCPLTGEVIEVNGALAQKPELVNNDPYGEGWLCRVKITDPNALTGLMSADDYSRGIAEEAM